MDNLKQFFGLAWPILTGLGLILFAYFGIDAPAPDSVSGADDPAGNQIMEGIKNLWGARGGTLLGGVSSIIFALIRDYSSFIPSNLHIEVFYDDDELKKTVSLFSKDDLADFEIASDWQALKSKYLEGLNQIVVDSLQSPFRFNSDELICHSEGPLQFQMKKIGQSQTYEIQKCDAELKHVYDPPGGTKQEISSSSILIEAPKNRFKLRYRDMFFKRYIVIEPEVKQTVRVSAAKELYSHSLTAVTKLGIFPYIKIGRTLFLARGDDGKRFPVAYSEYTY